MCLLQFPDFSSIQYRRDESGSNVTLSKKVDEHISQNVKLLLKDHILCTVVYLSFHSINTWSYRHTVYKCVC